CRHARRGADRHPRLRRQSRRETSGGGREPANFHGLPTDASDYSPDFVVALGRHRQMTGIAHDLLDQGYPFLMEKPMGINASEVEAVAAKADRLDAFVAAPQAQRPRPPARAPRRPRKAPARGPDAATVQRVGGSARRAVRGLGDDPSHGLSPRSRGALL